MSSGSGYDNGGLTTTQVMDLQNKLGVEADGMFGPNTMAAAGGLDAATAYQKYVTGGTPVGGSENRYDEVVRALSELEDKSFPNRVKVDRIVDTIEEAYETGKITEAQAEKLLAQYGLG